MELKIKALAITAAILLVIFWLLALLIMWIFNLNLHAFEGLVTKATTVFYGSIIGLILIYLTKITIGYYIYKGVDKVLKRREDVRRNNKS